jgi:hypothetical protein
MKKTTLLAKQGNTVLFKSWYAVLTLLLLFCSNLGLAQVSSYSFSQTADVYSPITGGTVIWTGYDGFDDDTTSITLPTAFVYQGVTYPSVFVSANGYVLFGSTTTTNTPISAGRNAVAAFAADLDAKAASASTGTPEVRWEQVGNEFVLQWANVCRYASFGAGATSTENLNFQIRLNTSNGIVKIVYGACVDRTTPLTTVYPQVGLGGGSTTIYNNRTIAEGGGDWLNSTAGTANDNTMAFNGTTVPGNGLTYTWSPPSCAAPTALTAGSLTFTSATIAWAASVSAPTNGYEYEVRTSGAAGSGATGLVSSGSTSGLNAPISGLTSNTTYSFYVRSNCGSGNFSAWSSSTFYTGYCVPSSTSNATYINNFSTTGGTTNISNLASGYSATGYQDNFATASVSQYPTGTINFASDIVGGTLGTSIWVDWNNDLIFDNAAERVFVTTAYGGNQVGSFVVPNGTPLGDYRMRIRVDYNAIAPDACASTNTRTEAEDYKLTVIPQPACLPPSGITASANTAFTATLNWTASVSTPSQGYDYFYASTNTAPTSGTTPSGSVAAGILTASISGLTPSTTYYVWLRSNCGSGILSDWSLTAVSFATPCNPPTITATTPGSVCGQGSAALSATSNEGTIKWYAASTGGSTLGTGNTFNTPVISTTTSYWAEASVTGNQSTVGPVSPTAQGGTIGTQTTAWNVNFTALQNITLISVDVYPMTSGQTAAIAVRNSSGTVIATYPFTTNVSGGATAQTVVLNHSLTPGNYQLYPTLPTAGVRRNTSGAVYPYTSPSISITGNGFDATYFMGFYNWQVASVCASPRTEVVATVTTPPALTLSTTTATICPGTATPTVTLNAGSSDYDTYTWTPAESVTGNAVNGWVLNPTVNTNYVLTASQSSGALCQTTAGFSVFVNPSPIISASAASATICEGTSTTLSANDTKVIGTATTLTVQTEQPTAFCNRWDQYWNQTIFTAAELQAAGLTAGNITSITYNITTLGSGTNVTNFSVRIGTTTNTTVSSFQTTGLTTVYGPATYTHAIGANTITFDTPYVWDGTSNIVLDIRQDGADSTNNAITYYTATAQNMTISATTGTDSAVTTLQDLVAASSTSATVATSLRRLNVVFGASASGVTWSWNPGALTGNSVSVSPIQTTTYTVTATNTTTTCSTQANVEVVVNAAPAPTGNPTQIFNVNDPSEATIASLVVTGDDLAWYASEDDAVDGLNELAVGTQLVSGTTYYVVSTSAAGCRSAAFAVTVTVTLGNDSFDLAGLKLYPNPVNSLLNVDYTDTITAIEVFNIVGQKVTSKNVNALSTTVDMSNLAAGTYFVKVQAANAARTIKVVKN